MGRVIGTVSEWVVHTERAIQWMNEWMSGISCEVFAAIPNTSDIVVWRKRETRKSFFLELAFMSVCMASVAYWVVVVMVVSILCVCAFVRVWTVYGMEWEEEKGWKEVHNSIDQSPICLVSLIFFFSLSHYLFCCLLFAVLLHSMHCIAWCGMV